MCYGCCCALMTSCNLKPISSCSFGQYRLQHYWIQCDSGVCSDAGSMCTALCWPTFSEGAMLSSNGVSWRCSGFLHINLAASSDALSGFLGKRTTTLLPSLAGMGYVGAALASSVSTWLECCCCNLILAYLKRSTVDIPCLHGICGSCSRHCC